MFKKRETVIQNIAYMAVMAAINVVFVLLTNVLPVLLFLLVFLLPLTSTIVTLYCKKRYFPIYFVVTIGLCMIVTAGMSIYDTFLYVFPSLVTGFLFGFMIEKKVPGILVISGVTIAQYVLTLLTFIFLDKVVSGVNLFNAIITAFGLDSFPFKSTFIQLFLYIVAQIQIVFTYLLIKYEVRKIGILINLELKYRYVIYVVILLEGLLAIFSTFYFPSYALMFVVMCLPLFVYEVFSLILKQKIVNYALLITSSIVSFFLFALLYQFVPSPNQLVLLFILFGLTTIIDLLDNYCFKQNK